MKLQNGEMVNVRCAQKIIDGDVGLFLASKKSSVSLRYHTELESKFKRLKEAVREVDDVKSH
jgi:hypothetical protein